MLSGEKPTAAALENAREMAYRFGINLVMYILTGNSKEDQVHIPDLLARLGNERQRGNTD